MTRPHGTHPGSRGGAAPDPPRPPACRPWCSWRGQRCSSTSCPRRPSRPWCRFPRLAQLLTQGSLLVALALALLANRRLLVRPTFFLGLLTVLALASFVVSLGSEFLLGSLYRGMRLLGFVAVLWLLSPWWGRRDLALLRAHRLCLWAVLVTVAPRCRHLAGEGVRVRGAARRRGVARAADPGGPLRRRPLRHHRHPVDVPGHHRAHALVTVIVSVGVLIGTHTRTALLGALLGGAVASASLFLGHARVRRVSTSTLVGFIVGATLFAPQLVGWLARGQSAERGGGADRPHRRLGRHRRDPAAAAGADLRVRAVEQVVRRAGRRQQLAGDLRRPGLVRCPRRGELVLLLLLAAATHVRGPRRALALFLIVYCIVASITETGLGDASPYLLDLAVAASLLAAPAREVGREGPRRAQPLPLLGAQRGERRRRPGGGRPAPARCGRRAVRASQRRHRRAGRSRGRQGCGCGASTTSVRDAPWPTLGATDRTWCTSTTRSRCSPPRCWTPVRTRGCRSW